MHTPSLEDSLPASCETPPDRRAARLLAAALVGVPHAPCPVCLFPRLNCRAHWSPCHLCSQELVVPFRLQVAQGRGLGSTGSVVNSSLLPMLVTYLPPTYPLRPSALCYYSWTGWGVSASGQTTWWFKTRLNQNVNTSWGQKAELSRCLSRGHRARDPEERVGPVRLLLIKGLWFPRACIMGL